MNEKAVPDRPVLQIQDLSVSYTTAGIEIPVLRNIVLEIDQSQIYGLVGESGSGKTTLGAAVMRYLPKEGQVTGGRVQLGSVDLLSLPKKELREIWGRDLGLVPQDPDSSLNPSLPIGEQLSEVFQDLPPKEASVRAVQWLKRVQIPDPEIFMGKYPHELSGGQKQRVLIAMAFSTQPQLLILDEPTTSLDVTTQAVILELLRDLIREQGTSVLYITHNLGLIADLADRVAVLYGGELVEDGPTDRVQEQFLHPYTRGLLRSLPEVGRHKNRDPLSGIPGQVPSALDLPVGCIFAARCPFKVDLCEQERPALEQISPTHRVRCHRWREIQAGELTQLVKQSHPVLEPAAEQAPVLQVEDLAVSYPVRDGTFNSLLGGRKKLTAVAGVDLEVHHQQTLGIVGESGSGKTSLALAVMGLAKAEGGQIKLLGLKLPPGLEGRDRALLSKLQMVFQNLEEAFSPYQTVEEILQRPLVNLLGLSGKAARTRAGELLEMVGLPPEFLERFSDQLSGGEKQRVKIARGFAANPDLLIADEPVSALDVSIQANILNLLSDLQRENQTAAVLISHDIGVVSYLADRVAVMYLGQIMQLSDVEDIFQPPYHPYTEALFSAIPGVQSGSPTGAVCLEGGPASPMDRPGGCPFHTRCPRSLGILCQQEEPPWQKTKEGKEIYCHIPLEKLAQDQEPILERSPGEDA